MRLAPRVAAPLLACVLAFGQQPLLTIEIQEGAGDASPRRLTVLVKDTAGRPAAGATVTFRLPAEGPSGRFLSGLASESLMTDPAGQASVSGIRWLERPGELSVRVVATLDGARAETQIPLTILPRDPRQRGDQNQNAGASSSSGRKWLILAGVAGGALAGIALAAGGKSAPGSPSVTPPSGISSGPVIQPPSITIGRP